MASYTAQIIVGSGGGLSNDGIIPIATLYLSENSRPGWILQQGMRKVTWIPTLDNMLEDGLLMLAIFVLKNSEIIDLSNEYFHNKKVTRAELYEDITEEHRQSLYLKCRSIEWNYKLIISVYDQAYIRSQLTILEYYSMELEICTPIFTRKFDRWSGSYNIKGSLSSI